MLPTLGESLELGFESELDKAAHLKQGKRRLTLGGTDSTDSYRYRERDGLKVVREGL
jgi:hypothetical protein